MTTYVLAGGCFWCLDALYHRIKGVTEVVSGYTGGTTDNPDYSSVSTETTGHAESVKITFDESIIPDTTILDLFFLVHHPTTLNQDGANFGTSYRSAMFYKDEEQKAVFQAAIDRAAGNWEDPIVTALEPLKTFYPAEEYHQDYFNKNPDAGYCSIVIEPKIIKARAAYKKWFKDES